MTAFTVGLAEDDLEAPASKDIEALVDYKQFYAKTSDIDDIESHRTDDQTILIGVHVPKHRSSRRRRSRLQSDLSDDAPPGPVPAQPAKNRPGSQAKFSDIPQPISSDRLREMLMGGDDSSESHMLFCELEELQEGEWQERARWVRFEEDVEESGGRWSKPFVATLPLHALFELRQALSNGVVMLDLEPRSYKDLVGLIVDTLVGHNQLESTLRDQVLDTLLSKHIHQHENAQQGGIRRGLSEIGKKLSYRKIDEGHHHHGTTSFSQLASHSNDPVNVHADETAVQGHQLGVGLAAPVSVAGGFGGVSSLQVPSMQSLAQPSSPTREESFIHKPNEHFAKKLPAGTEAASTLVGAVDYLNHTISAFIRLSNGIILDDLTEVAVPTRFIFIMLGPTIRVKDFHEIGRAMSTIMSDDIFRDVAYRSRDRTDMLAGLDEFLDEVTILPPGEWDPTIRIQPPKSVPTQEERKTIALNQIAEEQHETTTGEMKRVASSSKNLQGGLVMTIGGGVSTSTSVVVGRGESSGGDGVPPHHSSKSGASAPGALDLVLKKQAELDGEQAHGHSLDPALKRTGRIFGGLIADVRRKLPWYLSDITDSANVQCVASVVFLFFACLAPIVTFGGLLGIATDNNMAAFESILTGAICGTTYHLFAGQPMTIIGSTGPVLLFEKILFTFSKDHDLNYLGLRFWVGMWTSAFLLAIVAFDLNALVSLITRFTEECFATLISVIFIFEAFVAIYGIYRDNPISNEANLNKNYTCWCDFASISNISSSFTTEEPMGDVPMEFSGMQPIPDNFSLIDCNILDLKNCSLVSTCKKVGPGCNLRQPNPDIFFFSCLVFLGTCALSFALKNFRTSSFLPNKVRTTISDFAVSIAIFVMVGVDFLVGLQTPKLMVPKEFAPTRHDRDWVVQPFLNPAWTIAAAPLPAALLAVLLFMDQQITAVIVNRREHKLVKGKGYHLDLFVLTIHVLVCATFGLPYFVAATVLSITHVNSLRKQSETSAPGEQPKFLGLIEQRVTGFAVFALIGCAIPLRSILKFIPMPVLYGVFLFMGLSALQTSQFYNRLLLFFMPIKYQPDAPYLRHMRTWRVHLFTVIQLAAFAGLWIIKEIKQISLLFILMLVIMVAIRKVLDYVFTQEELQWVDDVLPKNPLAVHPQEDDNKAEENGVVPANSCNSDKKKCKRFRIWRRRSDRHHHDDAAEGEPLQDRPQGAAPAVIVHTASA